VFGSTGDGQTILDVIEMYKKQDEFKPIGSIEDSSNDGKTGTTLIAKIFRR